MAIKFSLQLATLLLLIHVLVAVVVWMTAIPLLARLAIVLLMLLSVSYYLLRDALLLLPNSWHRIAFVEGGISLIARNGIIFSGQITGKATVTPYFIVMAVKLQGWRFPVYLTLFPDMLEKGGFRELCVRLRFS